VRVKRLPAADFDELLDDVKGRGGDFRYRADICGTSMAPAIDHRDRVLVESALPEELSVGDVVVYLGEHGRKVAHRVVGVEGHGEDAVLVTRSDAPGARDEMVARTELIGRVIGVERASPWTRFVFRARRTLYWIWQRNA
jgi:signal peptidase I